MNADVIFKNILSGVASDSEVITFLSALFNGYPVDSVGLILNSANEDVVKKGAWIASELGIKAKPLIKDVGRLINHPTKYVRVFLLDVVSVCATDIDKELLANAVSLVKDDEFAVKWKVMNFLSIMDRHVLSASLSYQADKQLACLVTWLLQMDIDLQAAKKIEDMLLSELRIERIFGAIAAARQASHDIKLLNMAAALDDSEVAFFAKHLIRLSEISSRHRPRRGGLTQET